MPDDIATRTIAIIAGRSGLEAAQITRETGFEDIGISSLDLTEIVMDLEDLFDIQIDLNAAEVWDSLKSVGDVIDALDKLVSAQG